MIRACLLVCLLPWLSARAQEDLSVPHRTLAGVPAPNIDLPAHVVAPAGQLTLFADLTHPNEKGIPLYLVNRTSQAVTFGCQDGDIYLKLEHQLPDGSWQRAQTHRYSDCGNSYMPRILSPGTHFAMHGYRPARGQPAKIRYASYGTVEIMSNAGKGLFAPEDVRAAAMDPMSLQAVPHIFRRTFDPKNQPLPEASKTTTRLAALRVVALLGEIPLLRAGAQAWLKQLEALPNPNPDQRQALPLLREILDRDWGPRRHRLEPLLTACLTALKSKDTGEFGSLATERDLAWRIIREIGDLQFKSYGRERAPPSEPNHPVWREILELAVQTAPSVHGRDADPIVSILSLTPPIDESLPDAALEPLLEKTDFTAVAATILSRRGRWERLAELGFKLTPEQQIMVLGALSYSPVNQEPDRVNFDGTRGPRLPSPEGSEFAFWKQVIAQQPSAAGAALNLSLNLSNGYNPYRGELFEPIRSHWQRGAARAAGASEDFEFPSPSGQGDWASLQFIISAKDKRDIPLLRSLLSHRGYQKHNGVRYDKTTKLTTRFEKRVFRFRQTAADALRALGEDIPSETVFEEEIPGSHKTGRQ